MTTRRTKRDPFTRTVVILPERELSESILHLAAPLLERLGPAPSPGDVRRALERAIDVWNAHVHASPYWGSTNPRPLAALRKAMCGKRASPELAETFELLSARWQREFRLDPRLVGEWSLQTTEAGRNELICETLLPEGVEAHVPPPAEKRIAIGGKFLDEVRVNQSTTSYLLFPVERHRGEIGADGVVTIYSTMPTVLQLFAEGRLTPVGGAPVDIMVGGKELGPMVLVELRCADSGGYHDVAVLVLRPANASAPT